MIVFVLFRDQASDSCDLDFCRKVQRYWIYLRRLVSKIKRRSCHLCYWHSIGCSRDYGGRSFTEMLVLVTKAKMLSMPLL